ncbi:MAG TPA: c-type cytochrome [Pyrinomonadaceae bacterium]|nr:c-type cytochrome [Pyrinomonadaceae bacterium]
MKGLMAAAIMMAATSVASAQDLGAGETSFRKCSPCHDVGESARNKIGPKLNGLEGRKSGTIEEYSYTEANKNANITWNAESFKEYIADPSGKIPGTKMIFPGIKNDKESADLWAYLAQFKADGSKK